MHIQGCWKRTTSSGTHRLVFSSAQTATQCCGRTGYLTALLQVGRRFKVRSAYMLPLWWSKVLCNALIWCSDVKLWNNKRKCHYHDCEWNAFWTFWSSWNWNLCVVCAIFLLIRLNNTLSDPYFRHWNHKPCHSDAGRQSNIQQQIWRLIFSLWCQCYNER